VTPLLERYADRLGVGPASPVVSLGEGSTPLVPSRVIGPRLGVSLWFKWEGANPTGSYKDRGMTVAVSRALEDGAEAVVCASTGNTAASAAAYAARAGIAAIVLHPTGAVSQPKLVQTRALGARVLQVRGSFDEALDAARELGERGTHVLVNSLNPNRVEGQKTAVFELLEDLGGTPDSIYLPYGGGGNTTAYTRGLGEAGASSRLVSAQAADRARTLASAIRIGTPAHAEFVRTSGAEVVDVDDDAIVDAWRELAVAEGIFCEPASAAGVAALAAAPRAGETVVCVLTGHGLKDLEAVERYAAPPIPVDPDPDSIAAAVR
jgi:threonine synthase